MEKYDLGIVGSGPAGYTAALHAAAKGMTVVVFEKDEIGGICLNKGCIPTKTILKSSQVYKEALKSSEYGVNISDVTLDFSKVMERKNFVVEKLRKGLTNAFKNAKINFVNSEAQILSKNEIKDTSTGEIYNCEKVLCCIGASAKSLKGLEFDHNFILSSDDVLEMTKLPKSILIVGSGAIGIEWSRIFSNFGVETVLVELAPNLLPLADIDISKRLERVLKNNGVKFYTSTYVEKIENGMVKLSNGETLSPEKILVGAGRIPNKTDKIEGVKYLGDVAGEIQLAHFASKQSLEEILNIKFHKELTPSVVYGEPEIAWAGKREQDLEGQEYKKTTVLVSSLGKAWCDNQTEGIIKLIEQNNKITGVHIICAEASSMVQQMVIAIQKGMSADELKEVCFPHPTYCEGIFDGLFRLN